MKWATTEAGTRLADAIDTFKRLGTRPWTARAGNELRATGLSVGPVDVTGPASLKPQQREIAFLAAAGLTNKQIAERLFLSPHTVAAHLRQQDGVGIQKMPCPGTRIPFGSYVLLASANRFQTGPNCRFQSACWNGMEPTGYCVPPAARTVS